LIQKILNQRWRFNGEPIILGKTGLVLNGQHTLVAVIRAEQIRSADKKGLWKHLTEPITIEKAVSYGVEETDDVVNTMDTCKPRSLADIIYRSEYFAKRKPADRRLASRMLDQCIRMFWSRTASGLDPWAPRKTTDELTEVINQHPKMLKAVSFIMDEDKPEKITEDENSSTVKRISENLPPGYAACLLYLMGASGSNSEKYQKNRNEKYLDLTNWSKAEDYWVLVASKSLPNVRDALWSLRSSNGETTGTLSEKMAILVEGWNKFLVEDESGISLEYATIHDRMVLNNIPVCGGIDVGDFKTAKKESKETEEGTIDEIPEAELPESGEPQPGPGDPTPEEIAVQTSQIKAERLKKKGS
jgi:hypothetical protein